MKPLISKCRILIILNSRNNFDVIIPFINQQNCELFKFDCHGSKYLENTIKELSPNILIIDATGSNDAIRKTIKNVKTIYDLNKTILIFNAQTDHKDIVFAIHSGISSLLPFENIEKITEVIKEIRIKEDRTSDYDSEKKIYNARLHLLDFAINHKLKDVFQEALDQICLLTNSKIGFYYFLEDEKTISLQAWSTTTKQKVCKTKEKDQHYPVEEVGVWVECIKQRGPIIHNDYSIIDNKKGLPEGHVPVVRELVVPVLRSSEIVAVMGVGNKGEDYTEKDIKLVSLFADLVWDILEKKRIENDLHLSETRFRTFVEQANENIFLLTKEGFFKYISPNWKATLGYEENEVIGKSYEEFVFKDDLNKCKTFLSETFRTKRKLKGVEYRVRDKVGNWHWHTTNSVIIFDEENQTELFLGISHDISSLKESESKLKQQKTQIKHKLQILTQPYGYVDEFSLSDLLDLEAIQSMMDDFYKLTNIGIGIIDMDGNILIQNGWQRICTEYHRVYPETRKNCLKSDLELTRYTELNSINCYRCKNNMWDISTPIIVDGNHLGNIFLGQFVFEDDVLDEALFRQQAKKYGFDEDDYMLALNEVPRWNKETIETTMQFYTKLAQIISNMSLSNLKLVRKNEENLKLIQDIRDSEARYRALVNTSPSAVLVAKNNRYVFANPAGLKILGYQTVEAIRNQNVMDTIHPDSHEAIIERIKNAKLGQSNSPLELKIINKDGVVITTESTSLPIKMNGEEHILIVSYDITERKKIEADLKAANVKLQALWDLASLNGSQTELSAESMLQSILEMTDSAYGIMGSYKSKKGGFQINLVVNRHKKQDQVIQNMPVVLRENIQGLQNIFSKNKPQIFNHIETNLGISTIFPENHLSFSNLMSIPLVQPIQGNTIIVVANVSSPYDEQDIHQVKTFLLNSSTIQEKRLAEVKLKKSEILLKETQKLSKAGGWEFDVKAKTLYWSEETYRIHGLNPFTEAQDSNKMVENSLDCYYPEDCEKVRCAFDECAKNGTPYKVEARFRSYDGGEKWVQTMGKAVFDSGKVTKVQGNIIDITEFKEIQNQLKQQTNLLEASQKSAHLGSYIINLEDETAYWTDETFRIFGMPENSVTPTVSSYQSLVHPDDVDQLNACLEKTVRDGTAFNLTYRILRSDGEIRYVHSLGHLIQDEQTKVNYLEGTIQDVTESKELQISLQNSLREKEVLLREVHHRVKNNLASIIGLLELEKFAKQDNGENALFLNELVNRIRSISMVHENLYQSDDLSKIDFQNYLTSLVSHLKSSFQSSVAPIINVQAKNVKLSLELAVPCGLIINELITNAYKHAFPTEYRKGESQSVINIHMRKIDDKYKIMVKDNGIGLPEDINFESPKTMGMKLVKMLGEYQLRGTLEIIRSKGTQIELMFSDPEEGKWFKNQY